MDDTLKISLERTIDNALSSGDCDAMRNAVCVGLKAVISCQASTSKAVHEIQRSLGAMANRAEAYRVEVDPLTCQIQRLRDEPQPLSADVSADIESLISERAKSVAAIVARYPYPDE